MSCASCRPSWSPTRSWPKACGGSTRLARRSRSASRWRSTERAMNATVQSQPTNFLDLPELSAGDVPGILVLGGEWIMLTGAEMQLGRGETIADTARVLSDYVDAIVIRILAHDDMQEMAARATIPVINGLTKQSHPCQVLADLMTFEEKRGSIRGRKIAWSGDYNNVLSSWIDASAQFDFRLEIACPPELQPGKQRLEAARKAGANIAIGVDPVAAAQDAAAVISDCWVSMGDEDEGRRHNLLAPYQVNANLMSHAAADAIFMHCLPAHRGEEVTDEVIDGPQSVVFDEAENRLHAQKGVLAWCLGAMP